MSRTWLRWLPAAAVPVAIAAGALVTASQAGAAPELPPRSAEQVLAMVGESTVTTLSGTLEQSSDLGLPELPAALDAGQTGDGDASTGLRSMLELATSSHTASVFADGPTNTRVQVLDQLAERDVVRRGDDVWLYSSATDTATHVRLPPQSGDAEPALPGTVSTPAQLATRLLAAIDASTEVTVGRDVSVADRPAYTLTLAPRAVDSLIGSVSIAVDADTGVPLQVLVRARGQSDPAFTLAFTTVSFDAPDAARFRFTPPEGAVVHEESLVAPDGGRAQPSTRPGESTAPVPGAPGPLPVVTGTGWDAVLELPAVDTSSALAGSPALAQLTRPVEGGRAVHTALVNVLVTTDGRVFVGSVPLGRLQAVAAAT